MGCPYWAALFIDRPMYIDIFLALVLAFGFYVGYNRGIIKSLFAVVSLIVAVLAAMKLSPLTITFLDNQLSWDPRWIVVLGFVLTFMVVVIAVRYLGKMVEGAMAKLEINFINKMMGGSVSAFLFLVVFSTFIWFMDDVNLISQKTKEESMTYDAVRPVPQMVATLGRQVKPLFQNFWDKTSEAMDKIREEAEENKEEENKNSEDAN